MRASGPNRWISCFEIFVDNEAAVLDKTTFMNEVEIAILNILSTATDAQSAIFDVNRPLRTFLFLLLQFLHLLGLLIILGICLFIIFFLEDNGPNLFIHQFVIWFVVQRISLFKLDSQSLALLQYVGLQ